MADDFLKTKACPAGPTVSMPGGAQPSPPLSSSSLQEVTSQPVMGFDPLPPLDSIISYTRPERYPHPMPAGTALLAVMMPSGRAAHGCIVLLSSSTWEEEQPGWWCLPSGRAYRQDWSCCFCLGLVVAVRQQLVTAVKAKAAEELGLFLNQGGLG